MFTASGSQSARVNDTNGLSSTINSTGRSYILTRTGASARALYENGTLLVNDTTASIGLPTVAFYFLCLDSGGAVNFLNVPARAGSMGAGLNATQASNYYSRLKTFLDLADLGFPGGDIGGYGR